MEKIIKGIVIGMAIGSIMVPYHNMTCTVIPIQLQILKPETITAQNLRRLGAPEKHINDISSAIVMASKQTGLSPNLIIALMYTESTFDHKAVSSLNYRGLMQIPYDVRYIDANVLIGARIFKDKLKIANGDVRKAICFYKGWQYSDAKGRKQADKVIKIYNKLV